VSTLASAAVVATIVLAGLIVVLLAAVAIEHSRRNRRIARDARRRSELTPLVHALLDGDVDTDAALAATAEFDDLVLDLLPQLRGADRTTLQQALVSRGVVDRATADLRARAAWRRGRAVTLLGNAASAGHTGAIAHLLDDRDADVRCAAARALGKTGDPVAAPLLVALAAGDRVPAGILGMALLDLGTPVLPVLRAALDDPSPTVRALAADLLGLHGDPDAGTPLVRLVATEDQPAALRAAAAQALGRIGDRSATPTLCSVLGSPRRPALRSAAALALGRIGDPHGLDALVVGLGTADRQVRAACAEALVAGGAQGRARLTAAASSPGPAGDAARAAADALLPIGSRRSAAAS
jgi:HEAT repeat protein